ncbi:MAG: NAD-dependent succinate-semialdehyde dehydrogenase [Anaerolineae bacterium]|nr:NAD-dependent succinate-semialdehyde dehydrogenase [Anaerolineae bacterium]
MATHFINSEYVQSTGSSIHEVVNPATGEVVDTTPRGTVEDVNTAVQAAADAFPGWWDTPAAKRGAILYKAVEAIRANVAELAHLLTCEQGKPLAEAQMEIHRFAHTIEHYAGLAKNLRGGYVPNLDQKAHGLILKRPYGVCAAIVPWNFPVSLMGNKVGPALVAGNTMVVKPAETTPLTDLRVIELMSRAGLPAGVLNCVTGQGSVVGQALIEHPQVAKIGFTGSTEVGRQVMASAAKTIKRVTLELGGSDPLIVCDDADIDQAVSAASVGRFFNCGQACLAIKRIFVFEAVADEFAAKLVAKVKKLTVGPGLEAGSRLGPLHTPGQRAEIEAQVQDAVERGAKLLAGGRRPEGTQYERGNFYLPTVLAEVAPDSRVLTEEVFGPAVPIVPVKDLDEALARANSSIFGLGSSIWTRDLNKAMRAAERLEAGYTWINSVAKIYDELPFGGFKQSGVGQEHGIEAIDHYMATKAVVVKTQ